jgi:hypothetical protein
MPHLDLPGTGVPNSTQEKCGPHGNVTQRRHYGPDGRALKNIDYDHDYEGVGIPHAHDWDWTQPGKLRRQPARSLAPGEA